MKYGPWTITEADGELQASITLPVISLTQAVYALNTGMISGYTYFAPVSGNIEHVLYAADNDLQSLIPVLDIINLEFHK